MRTALIVIVSAVLGGAIGVGGSWMVYDSRMKQLESEVARIDLIEEHGAWLRGIVFRDLIRESDNNATLDGPRRDLGYE